MQDSVININGSILSTTEEAKVSVFDRGFLYGDSLYEVIRTYEGVFFGLKEHLDRLISSARLCRMPLDQSVEDFEREILKTKDAFIDSHPGKDIYCRIIVTRGSGRIGFGRSFVDTPTQFVILALPVSQIPKSNLEKGISLQVSSRLRNHPSALDPAMKSGNYLNSVLAFLDASDAGFDDAILCDQSGFVTEGTTFNIFYVKNEILVTPPLSVGILEGITRRWMLKTAKRAGMRTREIFFHKERLYEADEVMATGSVKEVCPVTSVDDRKIGDGNPGERTRFFLEEYTKTIKEECFSWPKELTLKN